MISVPEAVGSPDTGYFIETPYRTDRVWPSWSLRPFMKDYPLLAKRWDLGGPITPEYQRQFEQFVADTHTMVAPGVLTLQCYANDVRFVTSVFSLERGKGHFTRWLDNLPKRQAIAFPEVVNLQLAEILHRRNFKLMVLSDDDAVEDDWLPVHIREEEL